MNFVIYNVQPVLVLSFMLVYTSIDIHNEHDEAFCRIILLTVAML